MDPVPEAMRREVETFLSFVAGAETDEAVAARTFHITATYGADDYAGLADRLDAAGATGSFSVLARDLDFLGDAVAALDDAGHEIVLHGKRHTSFGEVDYETARDELAAALDAFEDAADVRPTGFHVPFMDTSAGTIRAASELGIEWVLGRTDADPPDELVLHEPIAPWDSRLLEGGTAPAAAFEELAGRADEDAPYLLHPNLQEYHGASEAFDAFLETVGPVTVALALDGGGAGMVIDCAKPIRVE